MSHWIIILALWPIFWVANILIAKWNDHVRRVRIRLGNPRQIEHFWYGLGYCILCAVPCWHWRLWWELGAILLLHISVFTVAYNLSTELPMFNLSRTSKALTDRALVWLGFKSYEFVAVTAFCISCVLFILQFFL